jgi:SiaC family regulatory phosphoprotein
MAIAPLHLLPTKVTPTVEFQSGYLSISGESFPEDAHQFFTPLLKWLDEYAQSEYIKDKKQSTQFITKLDYVNTVSQGFILQMIRRMNEIYRRGHKVELIWYYDVDEGLENENLKFNELIDDFAIQVKFIPYKTNR